MALNITKFTLVETDRFNQMAARPLQSHLTQQTLDVFQHHTEGGINLTRNALAGAAAQFIKPSADVIRQVNIAGGWGESRFRLFMEITENLLGVGHRVFLTGYTDHYGYAPGNQGLDPNMAIYFNNCIRLRDHVVMSPLGPITTTQLLESDMILRGNAPNTYAGGLRSEQTLRPFDIFATLGIPMDLQQAGMQGQVFDARTSFSGGVQLSRSTNAIPSRWTEAVFGGYTAARNAVDIADATPTDLFKQARGAIKENAVADNRVLQELDFNYDWRTRGFITLGELQQMCPHLHAITVVVPFTQKERMLGNHTVGTETWTGNSMEHVAADIVRTTTAALMLQYKIGSINFTITNATLTGQPIFTPLIQDRLYGSDGPVSYIEGLDISQFVQAFGNALLIEIMPALTQCNNLVVTANVFADVMSTTRVEVSINGQPFTPFADATFASNLSSSLIGGDRNHLQAISTDVDNLLGHVGADYTPAPNYQPITEQGATKWGL